MHFREGVPLSLHSDWGGRPPRRRNEPLAAHLAPQRAARLIRRQPGASRRGDRASPWRTQEVVRILMSARPPARIARPAGTLLLNAGIDLLPPWAQQMLGFDRFAGMRRMLVGPGISLIAPVMRWALVNGVSKRARRRVSGVSATR